MYNDIIKNKKFYKFFNQKKSKDDSADRFLRKTEETTENYEKEIEELKSNKKNGNCCTGCDGTGNIHKRFKKHYTKKNCPIYNARLTKKTISPIIRPYRINYLESKNYIHKMNKLSKLNKEIFFNEVVRKIFLCLKKNIIFLIIYFKKGK